jgi:hypothetical protein
MEVLPAAPGRGRSRVLRRRGNNAGLEICKHNVWKQAQTGPYVVIPAWWRHGVLGVLKPRQLAVYAYIACYADLDNAIAFPDDEVAMAELDVSADTLKRALEDLVDLGFLLYDRTRIKGFGLRYQRPNELYTMARLCSITDDKLRPKIEAVFVPVLQFLSKMRIAQLPQRHKRKPVFQALLRLLGEHGYTALHKELRRRRPDEYFKVLADTLSEAWGQREHAKSSEEPTPF